MRRANPQWLQAVLNGLAAEVFCPTIVQLVSFFKGVRLPEPLHRHTEKSTVDLNIVENRNEPADISDAFLKVTSGQIPY